MVRNSYYHDPARKHIEVFQDFSGGLNTVSNNDDLKDNELVNILNFDIKERGTLERRTGYAKGFTPSTNAIGLFDFQRTTHAYGEDGNKVEAGFPVFSEHGIRIEEPTQNEFTKEEADLRNWTKVPANETTVTRVTDVTPPIEGADVYKVTLYRSANNNAPFIYSDSHQDWGITTFSLYVMPVNWFTIQLGIRDQDGGFGDSSKDSRFTLEPGKWTRVWNTLDLRSYHGEPVSLRVFGGYNYTAGTKIEFYMCAVQIEDKDYPTSYIEPETHREGEALAVHGSVLNPQEGTIEGEFIMPYMSEVVDKYYPILTTGFNSPQRFLIMVDNAVNRLRVWHGDGEREVSVYGNTVLKPGVKYKFAYSWGQEKLTLYLNGKKEGERNTKYYKINGMYITDPIQIGRWNFGGGGNNVSFLNGSLGKLRFSRVKRDEDYILAGINGEIDEHTTLYIDFTMETLAFSYYNNKKPQGYFRFYRGDNDYDEILVAGGTFYVNEKEMPVEGGFVMQSERPVEAVQWRDKMYIASGNGLLEYAKDPDSGEYKIKLVEPHIPDSLEALYIGTNGLMQDPNNFIDDEIGGATVELLGVSFSSRYGVQNKRMTISAFVKKPQQDLNVQFRFERRPTTAKEDYWFVGRDWAQGNSYTFSTDWTGEIQFRISVRVVGETEIRDQFIVPSYIIKPAEDTADEELPADSISTCNRILLHWDRLIMYGDLYRKDFIYVSHLNMPNYFPVSNTLQFENPKREEITKIIRYRDNLVVFSPSSIQALYGKDPSPYSDEQYQRIMLNTDVGCIAPNTVQVVENHVYFLSYEGLYLLRSLGNHESRINVEPIDTNIKNEIFLDKNASAMFIDNQYHLVYPDRGTRLRFTPRQGIWTKDYHSGSFDFERMYFYDGVWYAQGFDGKIMHEDKASMLDGDSEYVSEITSKDLSFGEPYAEKKLREAHYMLFVSEPDEVEVEVWVDGQLISTQIIPVTPEKENYQIRVAGRGYTIRTVIRYAGQADFRIIGFGFVFKLKKP